MFLKKKKKLDIVDPLEGIRTFCKKEGFPHLVIKKNEAGFLSLYGSVVSYNERTRLIKTLFKLDINLPYPSYVHHDHIVGKQVCEATGLSYIEGSTIPLTPKTHMTITSEEKVFWPTDCHYRDGLEGFRGFLAD